MPVPTQPQPAEGARDDEAAPAGNAGVSADAPAEGADDDDERLDGSPAG